MPPLVTLPSIAQDLFPGVGRKVIQTRSISQNFTLIGWNHRIYYFKSLPLLYISFTVLHVSLHAALLYPGLKQRNLVYPDPLGYPYSFGLANLNLPVLQI